MTTTHLSRTDSTVSRILSASFPSYAGNRIEVSIGDSIRFHGTQWNEGNKNDYIILRLSDMKVQLIPEAPFMSESSLHSADYLIPAGFIVVCHVRGRYEHICITANSCDIAPMLSPPVELTDDEKIVLYVTRSLKSSYAGISNYRFAEAKRQTGITTERYEHAKSMLIEKKFLNKAGAITIAGRNTETKSLGALRIAY